MSSASPSEPRLALFDVDGTLLSGASSERRFAAYLVSRGVLRPRQALAWLAFLALHLGRYGRHVAKKDKAYLAGLAPRVLENEATAFVGGLFDAGAMDPRALDALQTHRARGDLVVLLTGTLQPIADALAARSGATEAIASTPAIVNGRCTSGPPTRHPFGRAKRELGLACAARHGVAPSACSAYGDSFDDRYLLEAVGDPVAVAPDAALARLAAVRGWRVLEHARSVVRFA